MEEATKTCSKCGAVKALDAFHRNRAKPHGRASWCKACTQPGARAYYWKNRERLLSERKRYQEENAEQYRAYQREYAMKTRFGITQAEWQAMFDAQGRACAICRRTKLVGKHGWNTDHCHATGVIRGILCWNCNIGLGKFHDSTENLLAAIDYLRAPTLSPTRTPSHPRHANR